MDTQRIPAWPFRAHPGALEKGQDVSEQKTTTTTTSASATWQLNLGRKGLQIHAGRHLSLSLSLPVLAWGASVSGLISTAAHWIQFIP
ncbi:hypothetical protein ACIA8J_30280 [Streptomyces asoensis]|uniref:hypothetical protein n=1 Tax=Streptomyces asoensis TaxID=249586 RepID=UPI0037922D63